MAGIITRRSFMRSMFAAPAIVAASNIMPVRAIATLCDGGFAITEPIMFLHTSYALGYVVSDKYLEDLESIRRDVWQAFFVPTKVLQMSPYPMAIAVSRKPRLNARA